jgi:hypothetical protein
MGLIKSQRIAATGLCSHFGYHADATCSNYAVLPCIENNQLNSTNATLSGDASLQLRLTHTHRRSSQYLLLLATLRSTASPSRVVILTN